MSVKGTRQLVMANRNTLLSGTPYNRIAAGLSSELAHGFSESPVKEYRDGDLPDKVISNFNFYSKQVKLWELAAIIYMALDGADVQIVSEKENSWSATGGVLNYCGNTRFMGIDFEYIIAGKERGCKVMGEVALDYDEHLALIQDSLVATAIDLNAIGLGVKGVQPDQYRSPKFVKVESPAATSLVNGYQLLDRRVVIKSVSSKLEYNRSDLNWVNVMIELKTKKADGQDLVNMLTKSRTDALVLEERFTSSVVERFNFGTGVFWRTHSFSSGQNNRDLTIRLNRNIAPFDISVNSGTQTLTVSE